MAKKKLNEKVIKEFRTVFMDKDFPSVVDGYEKFRRIAIQDIEYYKELVNYLKNYINAFQRDEQKKFVFDLICELDECLKHDCEIKENRQKLINCIGANLVEKNHEICKNFGVSGEYDCFLAIRIIADMICAASDNAHKLQWNAMFYQLMCNWNQNSPEEFREFYGSEAEKAIIATTLDGLSVLWKLPPEKWITDPVIASVVKGKTYVDKFYNEIVDESERSKQKKSTNSGGKKPKKEKDPSIEKTIDDEPESDESGKTKDKPEKSGSEWMRQLVNKVAVGLALGIMFVITLIAVGSAMKANKKLEEYNSDEPVASFSLEIAEGMEEQASETPAEEVETETQDSSISESMASMELQIKELEERNRELEEENRTLKDRLRNSLQAARRFSHGNDTPVEEWEVFDKGYFLRLDYTTEENAISVVAGTKYQILSEDKLDGWTHVKVRFDGGEDVAGYVQFESE